MTLKIKTFFPKELGGSYISRTDCIKDPAVYRILNYTSIAMLIIRYFFQSVKRSGVIRTFTFQLQFIIGEWFYMFQTLNVNESTNL